MKVVVIGGGGMARIVLALKFLIAKATERALHCSSETMGAIAAMEITAIANAVDEGRSLRFCEEVWRVWLLSRCCRYAWGILPHPLLAELSGLASNVKSEDAY